MSFMFEVYYQPPANPAKEAALNTRIACMGGRLDNYEDAREDGSGGVCLTYEFDELERAVNAANALRQQGEHVEGPVDYGT